MNRFYIGLDLGQKHDPSAIVIVERRSVEWASHLSELLARRAERIPLGTKYGQVVERVKKIVQSAELRGQCTLAVDATGLGAPVVDQLRSARLGCEVTAVTIAGGGRTHGHGGDWTVPKRDLVEGLVVLLEQGGLRIARKSKDAPALAKELMDVRLTARDHRRMRIGADGAGEHDDLAIALALACWRAGWAEMGYRGDGRLV